MIPITQYFVSLLEQSKSLDIAEAEFKRLLADDEELRNEYSEWCIAVGSSEKHGFRDFCQEYIDSQNDVWDELRDYDE